MYVTVQASLHVAPLFVLAGSIVASLDPSVYTVNTVTNRTQNVLSMYDMQGKIY